MRVLVAGWFSFPEMGATAGDLMVRDVACEWLTAAGLPYEIAVAPPFTSGVDWRAADPAHYSHVVFACGPVGNGPPIAAFLEKFRGRIMIGLNLTMLQPVEEWNPFDVLIERDGSRAARPDLALASQQPKVPVIGVILVHEQKEYKGAMHAQAGSAIARLVQSREVATVQIDTRLDTNRSHLRSPCEVESLIARMDAIVTTRLHGLVLALKNGVPPVAIDPIRGGAKVVRQARTLGWPLVFRADEVTDETLASALDFCLTAAARAQARQVGLDAMKAVANIRARFLEQIATSTQRAPHLS